MSFTLFPEAISPLSGIILVIASFFTSGLTAAAGIGGGMLMLALMTYLVPITVLIPVHGLIQLGSNAGRSWVQRANVDWHVTRYFLIGAIAGALLGAYLAISLPERVLQASLGLFILILAWMKFPPIRNAGKTLVGLGGVATTFVSMFAGATGPLVAVFLNKMFDEHKKFVATHGMAMVAQHGLKTVAFGIVGFAFQEWVLLIVLMVASGYLGTLVGTKLMNKLPENTLRTMFKWSLTIVALDLVRRGLALV